ncbi:MAG: hypothetical protein AVDCRST_MAG49-3611, partial [uncultured Thermomicrobiales bacterium]
AEAMVRRVWPGRAGRHPGRMRLERARRSQGRELGHHHDPAAAGGRAPDPGRRDRGHRAPLIAAARDDGLRPCLDGRSSRDRAHIRVPAADALGERPNHGGGSGDLCRSPDERRQREHGTGELFRLVGPATRGQHGAHLLAQRTRHGVVRHRQVGHPGEPAGRVPAEAGLRAGCRLRCPRGRGRAHPSLGRRDVDGPAPGFHAGRHPGAL